MTNQESNEALKELIESKLEAITQKMDMIYEQTKKTNGRVTKLEDQVNIIQKDELTHTINCPIITRVQKLEDDKTSWSGVKNFNLKLITYTGAIVAIIWTVIKIITNAS